MSKELEAQSLLQDLQDRANAILPEHFEAKIVINVFEPDRISLIVSAVSTVDVSLTGMSLPIDDEQLKHIVTSAAANVAAPYVAPVKAEMLSLTQFLLGHIRANKVANES